MESAYWTPDRTQDEAESTERPGSRVTIGRTAPWAEPEQPVAKVMLPATQYVRHRLLGRSRTCGVDQVD